MTLVAINPEDLDRAGAVLDHAAGEYRALVGDLRRAASSLPAPVAAWAGEECSRVTAGLHAEAEALSVLAARLRQRAEDARTADAADGRRGPKPPNWPHLRLPTPHGRLAPEDYLRWLRETMSVGLLAGPAGARLGISHANASGGTTTGNGSGGSAAIGIGLLLLAIIYVISQAPGNAGDQGHSNSNSDTQSKTEPTATAAPTESPCAIDPTPRPTDRLKDALDQPHLEAAKRELLGEVVARKPDGTPVDHVTEVRNAQNKLRKRIVQLKNLLSYPRCTPEQRAAAEEELGEASRLLDNSEWYVPPGI